MGGCLLSAVAAQASTVTLGWSSVPGSTITFNGNTFTINASAIPANNWLFGAYHNEQFHTTTEIGGTTGVGIVGTFGGGNGAGGTTYTIGTPHTTPGGVTVAPITTPATILLNAGSSSLTGTLSWGSITTWIGGNGGLNVTLTQNITPTSYTGNNWELGLIAGVNNGVPPHQGANLELTFAFAPGLSLAQLETGGAHTTGYSGLITIDPEPVPETSTAIAGAAGLGIVILLMALQRRGTVSVNSSK